MYEIGQKIKTLRELRNYTQSYVAERLNMAQPSYCKIESGETELKMSHIKALAELFEVDIEVFFLTSTHKIAVF